MLLLNETAQLHGAISHGRRGSRGGWTTPCAFGDRDRCLREVWLFFSDIARELLDIFSNRSLPDGRLGVFHPDNFSFGQPVFLSSLIATAQNVTGVESVNIKKFQRQGIDTNEASVAGKPEVGQPGDR